MKYRVKWMPKGVKPGNGALFEVQYNEKEDIVQWADNLNYQTPESYYGDYDDCYEYTNGEGLLRKDCWQVVVDDELEVNEFGPICP